MGLNYFILGHEPLIRFCFFFGILILMAVWELLAPRRPLTTSKASRWFSNLGIVLLDSLTVRLILPMQAVGMALFVEAHGWGILNNFILPTWMKILLGILGLDLVIYLQHAVFHTLPIFWRLHRMHHTDLDYDVTTGIRFHPLEILLSMGIKMAAVAFWGPSALAVFLFEVLLNATSMFNHGNVRLPKEIDRVLRLFEQHHIPANILVSLPSLEGIKRAVATNMGVALLPRRCAESEIARGELIALPLPEIRLRRQVRLVFRRGGERSHASAAFLALIEDKKKQH